MSILPPFNWTTQYGDIKLEGLVIHCSIPDVSVEIISPFKGPRSGSHMPYFGLGTVDNWNIDRENKLTEHGKKNLDYALIEAYKLALLLYENRDAYYQRILEYEKNLPALITELAELKRNMAEEKKIQKRLFKEGKIKEYEYAGFLKYIKYKTDQLKFSNETYKREIFNGVMQYDENSNIEFVKKYFE